MEFRDFATKELTETAERLARAAATSSEHAVKRVTDEARKTHDALRAELLGQVNEKKALAGSLKEAQGQLDALRAAVDEARRREESAGQDLAHARDAVGRLEAERRELAEARDRETAARAAAEADVHAARELLDKGGAELDGVNRMLQTAIAEKALAEDAASAAQTQAQAAEAKLAAVSDLLKTNAARVKTLERAQQEHERTIRELQAKKPGGSPPAEAARASVSMFEELLGAFQALAGATSVGDVLSTMIENLATEFDRVALFRVKSNHLQGEHQIGFDANTDISKVMIPLGMDSVLTRAVGSGTIERLSAEELADSSRVPFSGTPACAIALPVVVGDETLAIVYADDSGASAQDRRGDVSQLRVHFADAMLQHAVSLLMRMREELRKLAELRTYADSLLKEIQSMYVADADAGKSGAELRDRLKMNLEYAKSMYANRVSVEGVDAAGSFDEAVQAAAGAHPQSEFCRDLADLSGRSAPAKHAEAEAS